MSDTKTAIIDLAEDLIRTKGYSGFSYRDISESLNIKNAAIHYHFPSKANLGRAVISRSRESFNRTTNNLTKLNDTRKKVEGFIKIYNQSHKQGLVCFMGALGPVYDNLPGEMQEELTKASQDIRNWLTETLETGRTQKELEFVGSAAGKADAIITSLLASLILNKVTGENVLKNTVKQITQNI